MTSQLFVPGTVITSPWLNDTDTATYNNLTAVAGTNTITATGPISLTSITTGDRFTFSPAVTNTGATTININGLGVQPITKYGSSNLVAGDLVVGVVAFIVYDGSFFQLLNPRTQPSADITGQVAIANGGTGASTADGALLNLGTKKAGNYASYQAVGGTTTLTVADIGKIFEASVVAPTVNLPVGSTCALGDAFHFANSMVVTRQSTDQIVGLTGALVNSFTTGNYPITVTWRGGGVWSIAAGAVRALNTNPGYMNLPGGVFQQFGSSVVTTNGGGQQAISFATPFTGNPYTVLVSLGDTPGNGRVLYNVQAALTNSSFTIELRDSTTGAIVAGSAVRVNWIAIGTT